MKQLCAALLMAWFGIAHAQSYWDESPANWNNSIANWDNSPANWNNSPANWENSEANIGSPNGLYDNSGRRIGYAVREPSGVTNVYTNNGQRIGYVPAPSYVSPVALPAIRSGFTPLR